MTTPKSEWQTLPIGRIASPRLGGNYKNSTQPSKRPLIKMGNIARIGINLSKLEYIPDGEMSDPNHQLRYGDVLLNTRNTLDLVGKVSIWRNELPCAFYNSNILRLEFDPKYCGNSQYFGYALNTKAAIDSIRSLATGTTSVAAIYTRDLLKLEVPVPPLPQQHAIASALQDADELVNSVNRLIGKKKAIKHGLMQQLLTGRVRVPGFSGNWVSGTWGHFADIIKSGSTPKRNRPDYYNGPIPWVTSSELNRGTIRHIPQSITQAGLKSANLNVWPSGTFLMAITGLEAAGTRGNCGVLAVPAATNQSCMAIVPSPSLDPKFLYYYYLLFGEDLALKHCQGTKQQSYTARIVKGLPIRIPGDISEQKAIVDILACADQEIDLLTTKLEKAKAIKRGMMQELFTGRTRLSVMEGQG